MDKDQLIPIVAIGGGLAVILWLSTKNLNKADNPTMPYGWGSFQNSKNPVTPVAPGIPDLRNQKPTPPIKQPIGDEPPVEPPGGYRGIGLPIIFPPWGGGEIIPKIKPPSDRKIIATPIESKNTASYKPWQPSALRAGMKPLTNIKVI